VQCKNGYKNGLTFNDLSGFFGWMSGLIKLTGYVYYTNKLSENIKCLPNPDQRIKYIKQKYNEDIIVDAVIKEFKPYDYQLKAQKEFNNNFKNRGILTLPCGTGKTLISYLCSNSGKQIIIISPLKQFAKQNLDKFIEYGYKNNTLLVDSDGERDVKEIKKFIESNKSFLISSTFCSIDVIYESLKYMKDPLIIIDEFHNLSKNNVINEDDNFYKLLHSEYKILFVSATPRVYELENEDYELDLFGPIIYNMTFTEAIEKKYITDYKIWLPSIHEDNKKLDIELNIYEIDSVIKAKCKYLYSCLLNNGSRRCIIYCIDTKEIEEMKNGMKILNDFYCMDYEVTQITSNNTENERSNTLTNFTTNNKIQLLFSVRILDECIDIPTCDSIYITYPSKSKIRTIQRLCRCIRIDKTNKFKTGNIFIWCNEYDDILQTLSGIKEYDLFFKDKIMINQTDYFGDSDTEEFNNDTKLIEKYIVENNKRPSSKDSNKEIKQLGMWINYQSLNYKNRKECMKKEEIYNKFTEFLQKNKKYFLNENEEWNNNLQSVEEYINKNKKLPTSTSKEIIVSKLGQWLSRQKTNFKNNKFDEDTKVKWEQFIDKYKDYLMDNITEWNNKYEELIKYLDEFKKRPSKVDKDIKVKQLNSWLSTQINSYKKTDKIMKDENIRKKWNEFINDDQYEEYFDNNNEDEWFEKLNEFKKYIIENKSLPHFSEQLGTWYKKQIFKYKNKKNIMTVKRIYDEWTNFNNDTNYYEYLNLDIVEWKDKLSKLEDYIIENDKRPSAKDPDENVRALGNWCVKQIQNYKNNKDILKKENIRKIWKDFCDNNSDIFD